MMKLETFNNNSYSRMSDVNKAVVNRRLETVSPATLKNAEIYTSQGLQTVTLLEALSKAKSPARYSPLYYNGIT